MTTNAVFVPTCYACRACRAFADRWSSHCPACGVRGSITLHDAIEAPRRSRERGSPARTLADAAPLHIRRVSTGISGLDRVLGQDWRSGRAGLAVPSQVLFAAAAGTGKTTLLLRLASSIRSSRFLYLTTEQTIEELRDYAERIGIPAAELGNIRAERVETVAQARAAMKNADAEVCVIDSLNELVVDPRRRSRDVQQELIDAANALKAESEKHGRGLFLIAHMNKQEEISGVQRLQHIVSAVMRMDARGEEYRVLRCSKNRMGNIKDRAFFQMTPRGLVELTELPREANAGADTADKKRQRFQKQE